MLFLCIVSQAAQTWQKWFRRNPDRVAFKEDEAQRRRELAEAFRDDKPLAEGIRDPELDDLFQRLGEAFRAQDQERLAGFFDSERLYDELVAQDALPAVMRRDRASSIQGLHQGLGRGMKKQAPLLQWNQSEVRSIKKLPGDEVIVAVRHRKDDGIHLKFRWWLTRRHGSWKIFDMEDLDSGLRTSTTMAVLMQEGIGGLQETARALENIRTAIVAVSLDQDADAAERKLKQVASVKLPGKLEAVRALVTGIICLHRNQFKEALDAFDKAQRLNPDMPILDLMRGFTLNHLGQWDQALKPLEAYRDLLGEDAMICRELGTALCGVRRFADACTLYRKALDHDPKDADAFLGLLRALEDGAPRDDVPARFARLDDRHENFDIMAEDCRQTRDAEGITQLAQAMRKIDPRYPAVDYYLSLTKAWAGQADQATAFFKTALARQADRGRREVYFLGFMQAMADGGLAAEAYAVAPDPTQAFQYLAAELKKKFQPDELKQLISTHGKKHPADPLLLFYQGEVYAQEGRYLLAEKAFTAGLAQPPDPVTLAQFRSSRVLARYHTCQALSAYAEIGPVKETFRQLVFLCLADEHYDQMQALLDAHARTDPEDADLLRYRSKLKIKQNELAEGIALFKAALAKQAEEDERQELESDFLIDMAEAGKPLEGYQAAADAKHAFRVLTSHLREELKRDDLRRLIDAHHRRQPDDPWLAYHTAQLLIDEKAWDHAVQVLEAVIGKAPEEINRALRWTYVQARYKAGLGLQTYDKFPPRKETFTQLANLMSADKNVAELEALIAAHRPHAGADPDLPFYEARVKVFRNQPAEAIPLFQKAFQQMQPTDYRRRMCINHLVQDLKEMGDGLEGYRVAPDRALAFEILARDLVSQKKAKELARLLEEHGKAPVPLAPDLWHHFFSGELHLLQNEPEAAERAFAAALAKGTGPNQWTFREGLFRARVKAGKTVETYKEFSPGTRTFQTLARLCLNDKNVPQLEALLAAHRKAQPDAANVAEWEVDLKWLKQDYEGTLKLLSEQRQDLSLRSHDHWKLDGYLVRCLVKLKRTEEAIQEAEAVVKDRHGDHVLLILAHAAGGDAKQTIAAMEKLQPQPWFVERCYEDADLGPLLRSEPFREFRTRFPEPKEKMRER